MYPDFRTPAWLFYIWIFILLWRAACLQGEDEIRQTGNGHMPSLDKGEQAADTNMVRKAANLQERTDHRPNDIKNIPDKVYPAENIPIENKPAISEATANLQKEAFEKVEQYIKFLETQLPKKNVTRHKNSSKVSKDENKLHFADSTTQTLEKGAVLAASVQSTGRLAAKTDQPSLDTGQRQNEKYTPPPLDTGQGKKVGPVKSVPGLERVTTRPKKPVAKVSSVVQESIKPKTALTNSQNVQNNKTIPQANVVQNLKSDTHMNKPNGASERHKPHSANNITPVRNFAANETNSKNIKVKTKDNQASNTVLKQPNSTDTRKKTTENGRKPGKSLKIVPYAQFVQNMSDERNGSDGKLHFRQHKDVKAKNSKTNHPIMIKQPNHMEILQNATKEAEYIQNRLKMHKLKLKSYMEVLKNVTEQEIERNKKGYRNYSQSIRDKVKDIVNPKKKTEPNAKEKHPKEQQKHLLNKDIPDTLRARVDVTSLKKSEQFWDKKGDDVYEPLLDKEEPLLSLDELTEQQREMASEDQLNSDSVAVEYQDVYPDGGLSQQNYTVTTEKVPHEHTAEHLDDLHQTKLNEIRITRDRLRVRTEHEMFLLNQMVSARIHGNVLAPPPERCSVRANMKRYRPPEETMKKDESLLYRIDLSSEYKNALDGGPMNYLTDYKNPCWLSKITDDKGSLWYDYTESGLTYKRMSFLFEMRLSKDSNWRMRCLPLLFLVGVTKGGTTDLYTRLLGHPDIMRPGHKEPMWWNRLTLGMAQSLRKSFRYYLDFFDEAAELLRRKVVMEHGKPYHPGITVDATPANLWDYDCWTDIPGNRGLSEPKYTLAHSIKKLIPNAKILMILREPSSRLYSQYRMKSHMEPSSTFHRLVMEAVVNFNKCLTTRTLRSCAYDYEISTHEFGSPGGVFLRASLYYVFVKDWLDVFPEGQVMVLRSEDYHNDTGSHLEKVFDFLDIPPLSTDRLHAISKQRSVNTRSDHFDRSLEPMLPETQRLLDDFFKPYNGLLANLLHDKRFKWNDERHSVR